MDLVSSITMYIKRYLFRVELMYIQNDLYTNVSVSNFKVHIGTY